MSNISRASVPRGHFARYRAMSSSVQGRNPPLSRDALALPDRTPIVGSSSSSRWPSSIIQRIRPRSADSRLPACDGVRAFISALMTLRVRTEGLFPIVRQQAFNQTDPLEPGRFSQALEADAEVAEPVIAL